MWVVTFIRGPPPDCSLGGFVLKAISRAVPSPDQEVRHRNLLSKIVVCVLFSLIKSLVLLL